MGNEIVKFDGNEIKPKLVWTLATGDEWNVSVEGWPSHNGEWKWNVHLHVTEKHAMFNWSTTGFYALPFHGGISYDRVINYGWHDQKYDWQRDQKVRKVGSDYAHEGDWYGEDSPMDGIPTRIYVDATDLIKYMRDFDKSGDE